MLARMVRAWLAARSLARGLPAPVDEAGGYRVDVHSDAEVRRWVFPEVTPELGRLARSITQPRHFIKLCGDAADLLAALPAGWLLSEPGHLMVGPGHGHAPAPVCPTGYRLAVRCAGGLAAVHILAPDGTLAASGHAAELDGVFIYDRIITEPGHQRRGLGRLLMQQLGGCKRDAQATELLVATDQGRALYAALGWSVLSPFSTAALPD
ncbi:GNAT family N-acetyltransferase [Mitsuaria sp. WAJ17]|uniref:GNAT family N-acetyltransferase n=1 Tax=Mitsuaria sp. WAJ17 TaxID=2761452 RepID=UPI001C81B98E|nr:GNAT family N-acetyltransferase [Mitsuaria sp. WAJ17]